MVRQWHSFSLIFKVVIGLCTIWNNDGFINQLRTLSRLHVTNLGQQWNQPYISFSSFTTKPSTVQQLTTDVLLNSNATTNPLGDSRAASGLSGTAGVGDMAILKKEMIALKVRLEKVEKSAVLMSGKKRTGVSNFVESLQASTLAMNAKTVEICAVVTFFTIGTIVGASLLDRLWLLGGILAAWWSSGAVHRDTRGGMLARRVGVQVAQFIRDIQEKYNQFVIFYRTGKLAYISSKTWEQYDTKYSITNRVNTLKKLAMRRATEFNSNFKGVELGDQLSDLWQVVVTAPTQARKIDKEYGVTSTVSAFSRGILNTVSDGFAGIVNRGSDQRNTNNKNYKTYSYNKNKNNNNNNLKNKKNSGNSGGFLNNFSFSNFNINFKRQNIHYRGQNINPWRPFWQFVLIDKKQEKKRIPWFSKYNFNSQNVGNKISLD